MGPQTNLLGKPDKNYQVFIVFRSSDEIKREKPEKNTDNSTNHIAPRSIDRISDVWFFNKV